MCIAVCIEMFFDFIFINKIMVLMLFVGSYYRTISTIFSIYTEICLKLKGMRY